MKKIFLLLAVFVMPFTYVVGQEDDVFELLGIDVEDDWDLPSCFDDVFKCDSLFMIKKYSEGIKLIDNFLAEEKKRSTPSECFADMCGKAVKIFSEQENYTKAHEYVDKGLTVLPSDLYLNLMKANLYMKDNKPDKAIGQFNTLIEKNPNSEEAYYYRAELQVSLHNYEAAINDYLKYQNLISDNESIKGYVGINRIIYKFTDNKENNKIHNIIDNMITKNDRNEQLLIFKSWIYSANSEYTEAIKLLNKAINININNTKAISERAKVYKKMKMYDKAVADYKKNKDVKNIEEITTIYKENNQFDKAIYCINILDNMKPSDDMFYLKFKSEIYTAAGKHNQAIAEMNKAVQLFPNKAYCYYWRAVAKENAKKYDAAISDYQKCQDLEPENSRGYQGIAGIYKDKAEYTKALQYIDKAIGMEPNDVDLLITKSQVYTAEKKHQQAIATMDKAVNLEPQTAGTYYWRAVAKKEAKKYDAAISDYQKCQDLEPENSRGYQGIAGIYKENEEYTKAHQYIDKAIGMKPNDVNLLITKSQVYTAEKKHQQAIATMDKAINIEPQTADVYYWRAVAQSKAKKNEDAYNSIKKAISYAPKSFYLYKKQIDIEIKLKLINKALLTADKVIKINPNIPNGYKYKANVYHENRDYNNAIRMYNIAISKDKTNSYVYKQLSQVYIDIKNYDKALLYINKAFDAITDKSLYEYYYDTKIIILLYQKNYEEAEKYTNLMPQHSYADYFLIGMIGSLSGSFVETVYDIIIKGKKPVDEPEKIIYKTYTETPDLMIEEINKYYFDTPLIIFAKYFTGDKTRENTIKTSDKLINNRKMYDELMSKLGDK